MSSGPTMAAPREVALGRCLRHARRLALGLCLLGSLATSVPATATSNAASHAVALIPTHGSRTPPDGQMPITGIVSGVPADSFSRFRFTDVPLANINTQTLAQFDTAVLMQVATGELSPAQKSTLAQFVTNGGKLIIHDSDETTKNDYTWLPYPARIADGCVNCGATSGSSRIVASNGLISANPADPAYINLTELDQRTDAIGDANLFLTLDPHWAVSATVTNARGETGAVVASASDNGLMIYNGYDTDYVRPSSSSAWLCLQGSPPAFVCPAPPSGVDWLAKMWFDELAQSWGMAARTPSGSSALGVGQTLAPAQLGVSGRCVARRKLSFSFRNLHTRIRQADAYVNGRHVLRVRANALSRLALTRLPKRGAYSVKLILTTRRGYHLIMRSRFHAC
jgi:hypothetical protein